MFSSTLIFIFFAVFQILPLSTSVELEKFRHSLGIGRNQLSTKDPPGRTCKYLVYSGYAKYSADTNDLFDDEGLAGLG